MNQQFSWEEQNQLFSLNPCDLLAYYKCTNQFKIRLHDFSGCERTALLRNVSLNDSCIVKLENTRVSPEANLHENQISFPPFFWKLGGGIDKEYIEISMDEGMEMIGGNYKRNIRSKEIGNKIMNGNYHYDDFQQGFTFSFYLGLHKMVFEQTQKECSLVEEKEKLKRIYLLRKGNEDWSIELIINKEKEEAYFIIEFENKSYPFDSFPLYYLQTIGIDDYYFSRIAFIFDIQINTIIVAITGDYNIFKEKTKKPYQIFCNRLLFPHDFYTSHECLHSLFIGKSKEEESQVKKQTTGNGEDTAFLITEILFFGCTKTVDLIFKTIKEKETCKINDLFGTKIRSPTATHGSTPKKKENRQNNSKLREQMPNYMDGKGDWNFFDTEKKKFMKLHLHRKIKSNTINNDTTQGQVNDTQGNISKGPLNKYEKEIVDILQNQLSNSQVLKNSKKETTKEKEEGTHKREKESEHSNDITVGKGLEEIINEVKKQISYHCNQDLRDSSNFRNVFTESKQRNGNTHMSMEHMMNAYEKLIQKGEKEKEGELRYQKKKELAAIHKKPSCLSDLEKFINFHIEMNEKYKNALDQIRTLGIKTFLKKKKKAKEKRRLKKDSSEKESEEKERNYFEEKNKKGQTSSYHSHKIKNEEKRQSMKNGKEKTGLSSMKNKKEDEEKELFKTLERQFRSINNANPLPTMETNRILKFQMPFKTNIETCIYPLTPFELFKMVHFYENGIDEELKELKKKDFSDFCMNLIRDGIYVNKSITSLNLGVRIQFFKDLIKKSVSHIKQDLFSDALDISLSLRKLLQEFIKCYGVLKKTCIEHNSYYNLHFYVNEKLKCVTEIEDILRINTRNILICKICLLIQQYIQKKYVENSSIILIFYSYLCRLFEEDQSKKYMLFNCAVNFFLRGAFYLVEQICLLYFSKFPGDQNIPMYSLFELSRKESLKCVVQASCNLYVLIRIYVLSLFNCIEKFGPEWGYYIYRTSNHNIFEEPIKQNGFLNSKGIQTYFNKKELISVSSLENQQSRNYTNSNDKNMACSMQENERRNHISFIDKLNFYEQPQSEGELSTFIIKNLMKELPFYMYGEVFRKIKTSRKRSIDSLNEVSNNTCMHSDKKCAKKKMNKTESVDTLKSSRYVSEHFNLLGRCDYCKVPFTTFSKTCLVCSKEIHICHYSLIYCTQQYQCCICQATYSEKCMNMFPKGFCCFYCGLFFMKK